MAVFQMSQYHNVAHPRREARPKNPPALAHHADQLLRHSLYRQNR